METTKGGENPSATKNERMLSVLLPTTIHERLEIFVFKARQREKPTRVTTKKNTVANALDEYLPPLEE